MKTNNHGRSVYTSRPEDGLAVYFTPENYPILNDPGADVSAALQSAITRVWEERNAGIVFIPEGRYNITQTIMVPKAVRLIGYGESRPVLALPPDTPGFDGNMQSGDNPYRRGYPGANYMLWFTDNAPDSPDSARDAGGGTFYSAMSNIDFEVGDGNPGAVCVRAHFAQHGFVSHCDFHVGGGLAGMYEVGNEMENLAFYGGEYGIISNQCSPGWPFVLMDTLFEGQRKSAIHSCETGYTMFRVTVRDCPAVVSPKEPVSWEKLYMEDCLFENISGPAISFHLENNAFCQINLKRVLCRGVPTLIRKLESGDTLSPPVKSYIVESYTHGQAVRDMSARAGQITEYEIHPADRPRDLPVSDIPALPAAGSWISVREFGAVGDHATDDTEALRKAAASGSAVYFPQGLYRVTDTVSMSPGTSFIGLNPWTTQILIADDTPAYEGFGSPKAVLESSREYNLINGIGIDTGGKNPRAAGIIWRANADSYMNDVKFVGGHGLVSPPGEKGYVAIYDPNCHGDINPNRVWDSQFPSLWVTEGGGGTFKDIWSASPYSEAGISVTSTKTRGRMYCVSLEHHVRIELKMRDAENWEFFALQTEEEVAEGTEAAAIELVNCKNILFGNLWIFRVAYIYRPHPHAMRVWNCGGIEIQNVHSYGQMQYVFDNLIYDPAKDLTILPWECALIKITGDERGVQRNTAGGFERIADGLSFASGAAVDSRGNLVFCDKPHGRIYRWLYAESRLELLCDIHFSPICALFDSEDNLIIIADYTELKDSSKPRRRGPAHPFFMWFGIRGPKVYTINPDDPYNSMREITRTEPGGISPETVYLPAHAWYPTGYMEAMLAEVPGYYMAPDGKTAISATMDIGRSLLMKKAVAGEKFLCVDDFINRTYSFDVDADGRLKNPEVFAERGRYGVCEAGGYVYAPDGEVYIYGGDGKLSDRLSTPDRVTCIAPAPDGRLYFVCRNNVYIVGQLSRA